MNRHAMTNPLRRTPLRFPLGHVLRLALAGLLGLALVACQKVAEAPPLKGAKIGGEFTLVDRSGRTLTWGSFNGRWRIVYFGYTYCPDACPTDVAIIMKGYRQFAKEHPQEAADVQPIFITVDPARDTQARIGEFADAFGSPLIALTGSQENVDEAARAFAVYHNRGKDQPGGGYLVDHSRAAYLMDPDGQPIAILPTDLGPQQGPPAVAAELAKWVR
ncbi:SCO family protein [Novosphingobium flavum]|uniref:SCO family protein n=2 Tax=Novosphingobium aerophilum TaxID=2839843 RepID=A0A7X1F9U0_9SPHN|nr:SCO family protein [Novosphingobium aerophilum]MBC2661039.1 SCO family protein [Novosphingobium aerophilum]